jgi:hypothetical protein
MRLNTEFNTWKVWGNTASPGHKWTVTEANTRKTRSSLIALSAPPVETLRHEFGRVSPTVKLVYTTF